MELAAMSAGALIDLLETGETSCREIMAAVLAAIESDALPRQRYESYLRMFENAY